ncbi:molybdate transport system ATP-binding protein [Nitratiruptor sp. YY08-26]|uniref:ATP-binding cassette domain-containing protein n=1 Tax=unclassified Nitratiruptor TaxID=2624044 RepID=UPI0019159449|nr:MULTISPECIES: ATP-binding cassette domain-containing protein [unclassified Nitratiruptor]BCD61334.1 molybdate transport system ATP-binding protein [Nitratiruptor sp. YY08-13]BCD65267.1 molybdate transport system ATP-binding protein [Nitratiruptor sp. YY08-26]
MIAIGIYKELRDFSLEISLRVKDGEFVAITGASGSGKTTFLRVLAGLEGAKGAIKIGDVEWLGNKSLPPQKRAVGFVFQDYALFPNMSVLQNLLFVRKDVVLAMHLLKITDMLDLKDRYPSQLSGGQKQRVALARAYMKKPKIMLLDEPLAALDPAIRSFLQGKIRELHEEFGTTTFMVSHDIAEIYRLSTRVIEIERGKILRDFTKEHIGKNKRSYKAEIVDVLQDEIVVAFMGDLFRLSKKKAFKVGDIVEVTVEELQLL